MFYPMIEKLSKEINFDINSIFIKLNIFKIFYVSKKFFLFKIENK